MEFGFHLISCCIKTYSQVTIRFMEEAFYLWNKTTCGDSNLARTKLEALLIDHYR
jgi:hypothetical protein